MKYEAQAICPGIAIGPVFVYKKFDLATQKVEKGTVAEELAKFEGALGVAADQLKSLFIKALRELGKDKSLLFEVHQMLIQDDDFRDEIRAAISDGMDAPHAVEQVGRTYAEMMAALDDPYMKERALDFRDISNRLIRILCGVDVQTELDEPAVILAEDLEPSETVGFKKDKVLGFVLREGSPNSHTAILARGMNVPALIQTKIDLDSLHSGTQVILDAKNGCFIVEPEADVLAAYDELLVKQAKELAELEALRGKPSLTKSGKKIKLYNNIGNVADIANVDANDGEGVGLFRSEFLYMGRSDLPSEEEQTAIYTEAVKALKGKTLIVRTMDIGADKKVDSLGLKKEENPALGMRALRICLRDIKLFKDQLKALLRASAHGPLMIMVPMIISVEEVLQCKNIIAECRNELAAAGTPMAEHVPFGIMIETPAAAMLADELAKEVEFFSVGTNDLTQYTLAVDRQNAEVADLYTPKHPAVMKMLKMIAEAAVNNGIWAGICGEFASDTSATKELLSYGYTELSVSPGQTLRVRHAIEQAD